MNRPVEAPWATWPASVGDEKRTIRAATGTVSKQCFGEETACFCSSRRYSFIQIHHSLQQSHRVYLRRCFHFIELLLHFQDDLCRYLSIDNSQQIHFKLPAHNLGAVFAQPIDSKNRDNSAVELKQLFDVSSLLIFCHAVG